ncbi:hypothetical protein Celaphus_00013644 [Cervus elaphus hippelaphus]|uniref:BED-type domain-containing protein n=1 Tax=Cervus elaphus hippelaphus TaxID=46360 RepID=A0A212CDB3_CEREH|nr:hypothetical protein Celaphus_00013644 [Cervus elaphus hippelaphus]
MDFGSELEDGRQAGRSEEPAAGCAGQPPGRGASPEPEDDYGALLAQYGSTLYSVAMEAVTQSLLSGRGLGSRKKSPAWKHFFISPRDSTKAVCTYCMKEFSRGKNEKDLSTSCLMRHVRRAHPTALAGDPAPAPRPAPTPTDPEGPCPGFSTGPLVPRAASKGSAPLQLKEEASSAVSSEEAASDKLASERYGRDERPPGQPPHAPPLHCREPAENGAEKNPPLPRSACGSRRRSAVWKHFYLSPLDSSKAVCIHCMNEFSRGKNGKDLGTSCLIRHMWRAHRAINKRVMKRLKSEVWHHFSLAPTDSLKAVCRHCGCAISRGKRGDVGTSCLMRHLYRRHPEVSGGQKGFLGAGLAGSPYATLASAETSSRLTDLPTMVAKNHQAVFPVNSKKTSKLWNHFSICSADPTKVVCLHCGRTISRGKKPTNLGTSCLLRHLQRFHGGALKPEGAWAAPPSSPGGQAPLGPPSAGAAASDEGSEKFYESHPVAKKITSLIAEMIALDLQPYSLSVCHALTPFAAASREMSAHVSTLSQVIPMIHILSRRVEMLFQETTGIDAMLRALREAMVSRLSASLHDPRYVLATLLDPRYKASLFSEEEAEQYKQDLIRELETLDPTSEPAPVPNGCEPGSPPRDCAGEESLWALMAKLKKSERGGRPKVPEDVVLAYLEEEVLEHSCDPLAYWSLKRAAWPGLSALAVRFLGCPPSIVPSERLFSTPPENGSFGQSRLLMEHFEKLIFLKVNLPLICFQY